MLTEYHCHILPGLDDGADSVETAIKMIARMHEQGVRRIVSTSHFYCHREASVAAFLEKRRAAFEALMAAGPAITDIRLGAEIAIEHGVSETPGLDKLAIEGTDLILMEFPYRRFEEWMEEELYNVTAKYDLSIIIAHVHRYLDYYTDDQTENLIDLNAILQVNNEAFENRKEKKLVKRLMEEDYPLVFGSDAHNNTTRKPNWDIAKKKVDARILARSDRLLDMHRI